MRHLWSICLKRGSNRRPSAHSRGGQTAAVSSATPSYASNPERRYRSRTPGAASSTLTLPNSAGTMETMNDIEMDSIRRNSTASPSLCSETAAIC